MSDDEMPSDPVTELAAGAAHLHEVYIAYLEAGFTDAQAMKLVCVILSASVNGGA